VSLISVYGRDSLTWPQDAPSCPTSRSQGPVNAVGKSYSVKRSLMARSSSIGAAKACENRVASDNKEAYLSILEWCSCKAVSFLGREV
jgi:hypothetical protein